VETDTEEESRRLHSAMIHLLTYVRAVGIRIYEKNANASHGARSYGNHSAEIRNVMHIRAFWQAGASRDVSIVFVTWSLLRTRFLLSDAFDKQLRHLYTREEENTKRKDINATLHSREGSSSSKFLLDGLC